jgi:uncharacterized protein (DUF433 family)
LDCFGIATEELSHEMPGLQRQSTRRMIWQMKEPSNQRAHVSLSDFIVADPEILGGEPVFRGTRVPVVSLFEHLESDCSLDEFLENFPTVSREAAMAVQSI